MRYRGRGSDGGRKRTPPPRTKPRRSNPDGRITESYSSSHFLQGQDRRSRDGYAVEHESRRERPSPRELERSRRSDREGREHARHYEKEPSLYDVEFPQREPSTHLNNDVDASLRYASEFEPNMTRIDQDNNRLGGGTSVFDGRGAYGQYDDGTLQAPDGLPLHSGMMGRDLFQSPSRNLDDLTYRNYLNQTPLVSREYYKEEEKRMSSSRNVSYPVVVSPQSQSFHTTPVNLRKEEVLGTTTSSHPLNPDGLGKCNLNFSDPFSNDQYKGSPNFESAREAKDLIYPHELYNSSRAQHQEYTYRGSGRYEKDDLGYPSDELYRKMQSRAPGDYENRVSTRRYSTDLDVDSVIDMKQSHRRMGEEVLSDHQLLPKEPVPSYIITNRKGASGRDEESFSTGGKYLEFGTRVMGDHENSHLRQGTYDFGVEGEPEFYSKRLEMPPKPERDPDMYRRDMGHQQSLTIDRVNKYEPLNWVQKRKHHMGEEMSIYEPSNRIQKRNHHMDEEMIDATRIVVSSRGNKNRQVHELSEDDEYVTDEDVDDLPSPKVSVFSRLQHVERAPRRVAPWLPKHGQQFATKQSISTKRKLGIKKRLRHFPVNVEDPSHLDRTHDFYKPDKSWIKSGKDHSGRVNADRDDPSEHEPANHDPPEGSEEFKHLVHKAFLRFYKHVNETSAQRRRYSEEGKANTLLCSICVSHSKKEIAFADTHSLVSHSFSCKIGSRVDHLGLHKALCVLMGWNSDEFTGNTWVQQVLPVAEAAALKESLIIWPPLVIINNSSIGTKNPEEQKVVTVEGMELILRDLGFSMTTTEVCRGKPANQSIMVVKFKPTFSGLQEAERLHKHYSEIKRGRQEFLQFSSSKEGNNNEESIGALDPLYGYLGIAEDLDKLEFETKKRCVVKSKKDIQTIADASLNTE